MPLYVFARVHVVGACTRAISLTRSFPLCAQPDLQSARDHARRGADRYSQLTQCPRSRRYPRFHGDGLLWL